VTHPLAGALQQGLLELGLVLSSAQQQQLLDYLDLMGKWNKVYNLTAVRDPQQMLTQHVLDCLAVVQPLRQRLPNTRSVLDVGAGGGLPAVVLAVACPTVQVAAVDTVAKKAAFIQTAAHSLGLPNLRGIHARVEDLTETFDVVCSRAFASLADFTHWSTRALKPTGVWMAMKGRVPDQEIAALPAQVVVDDVQLLQVPGLEAQRCVVWLRRQADLSDAN
jgi:16S rRNA (guanine527-N7)-methyltransferase